jgi:hypothetical protein
MKNDAPSRARKAVEIIRRGSLTIMATWNGNLYKRCLEGVAEFERLRPLVKPATKTVRYSSLMGQQVARFLPAASLDNVLTVLIGETPDHKWQWDIVTDVPGLCFGAPVGRPLTSREEAEKRALAGLALMGAPHRPADDDEFGSLDHWEGIRVNGTMYHVAKLTHDQLLMLFSHMYRGLDLSRDEVQINLAQMLLADVAGDPVPPGALTSASYDELKSVALAVLANTGWTHVSEDVLEGFAAANGVCLAGLEDKMRRCGAPKEAVR